MSRGMNTGMYRGRVDTIYILWIVYNRPVFEGCIWCGFAQLVRKKRGEFARKNGNLEK